jgi:hypothetical protein
MENIVELGDRAPWPLAIAFTQRTTMRRSIVIVLILSLPCFFAGCESSSTPPKKPAQAKGHEGHDHTGHDHDHDHDHDHEGEKALSLKDALAKSMEMAVKIREAGEKGDYEPVHNQIHEIGHLLDALAAKAKAENKSGDEQAAIKKGADGLFAAIDKIDGALHDGKTIKFDEVKDAFDSSFQALKAIQDNMK